MAAFRDFLGKLGKVLCWGIALLCLAVFALSVVSVLIDPLWRPTRNVPLIAGLVASASLGLAAGAQWRDRARVMWVLIFGVSATAIISPICYVVGSTGCDELAELERACATTGECADLSEHREELYKEVCRSRPTACKFWHHADPEFTKEDVTVERACGVENCPKNGRRCVGSRLETCDYPRRWVSQECDRGCIVDWRDGPKCEFEF